MEKHLSVFEKLAYYYFPAILWAGVIYYLSSIAELSLQEDQYIADIILRKLAHLGEYVVLSWLVWRVFYYAWGYSLSDACFGAILVVILYAISDEIHQMFIVGRDGKVVDVVIDALGSFMSMQWVMLIRQKAGKKRVVLRLVFLVISFVIISGYLVRQSLQDHSSKERQPEITSRDHNQPENEHDPETQEKLAKDLSTGEETEKEVQPQNPAGENFVDEKSLPLKSKALVPFTSQAPFSNWDEVHEDACEEASLLMIKAFLKGETLTPDGVEQELQRLVTYQNKKYGDYKDSDMQELVDIARDYYGIKNLTVVYDFSKEDLKNELAKGKPVILPTAGRLLGNPNFTAPGPLYHNIVAIGYEGRNIITNDPGTRKGKDYLYNEDVLYAAIHDFTGKKEDIEKGRKAMVVIDD